MSEDGYFGHVGLSEGSTEHQTIERLITEKLSQLRTNVPVKVIAVEDDPNNPGHHTLTVLPLINQVDGIGKATKHGNIYGIPALNMSGGNGMAYVKPKVGDLGMMAISDRDMSRVMKSRDQANPGSGRMHDMSQGAYIGGFSGMNGQPKQSVVMDEEGVHLKSDKTFFVEAPNMKFTGDLRVEGKIDATGEITAKKDGGSVTLSQHVHPMTPPPTPGT